MITYSFDKPVVSEYMKLRRKVGFFELTREQAGKSLDNALDVITVYEDEKLIGMGRLIGDGAVICYIQDVMVDPDKQGCHVGREIVSRLIEKAHSRLCPGSTMYLGLMSVKGTEEFYERLGFVRRPNERFGSGLTMILESGV